MGYGYMVRLHLAADAAGMVSVIMLQINEIMIQLFHGLSRSPTAHSNNQF